MNRRDLLIRVLKGEATTAQRFELERWLDSIDAKKATSANAYQLDTLTAEDLVAIRKLVSQNFKAKRKRRVIILGIAISLLIAIIALLNYFTTKPPVLVFQRASLMQVVATLQSTYSVTIEVNSEILPCTFTGEFHGAESVEEVLSGLCTAMHLQYIQSGKHRFEINGKPCN